ncbi:protein turtle homolog B isoform X1 [Scleropages formosus]|uniref:protein turtle homolog B isoform X1 n=1 Tax=Scleropages formosus TaxID=113540 RepID=UPI0010FAA734|nr:protein turtle homolog B-like isoform X1 [Scleropages formosus]
MIWYVAALIASVLSARGAAAQGARRAREEPQFVTARAGEAVVLGCEVSHPPTGSQLAYVVEWFRSGMSMPFFISFRFYPPHVDPEYAGRAMLHGVASLRIEQLRSEDQGWYECRLLMLEQQYDAFYNGSWVHLTVTAPPTFTDTPPQYVEAREGGSITLSCTALGNPKPVVSWLREGETLGDSEKYKVSDGRLTVVSVLREDGGVYMCRAHSPQGEVVHTTRLLVQGSPHIVKPPLNITVNISQNAFFSCQAEAYPGNLTYIWFWEEDNVYFKNDLKLRVRILIDGTLIIFRVKPEDAGKYTCSPSNSLGLSPTASAYLVVQYPARVVNMPPVMYIPKKMTGYIRCPVDANPPVTWVKWEKNGLPLRLEKHPGWSLMKDGSIRVTEVTEDSLGTYTCMPYNLMGTSGKSPPSTLVLKDPPYFSVRPGAEYRQDAGKQLLIPCAASGEPEPPTITWRKVGKPSRSKHIVLPSGSLQIPSLSKDDHGEWECVATNVVTSITASTRLLVVGTSPHAPVNLRVSASSTSANVSWDPGYDGGFEQTFSVWYGPVVKKARLGPHDWLSMPAGSQTWLLLQGLESQTPYQFSVLAQNKLGTGPFSEVVSISTLAYPRSTPEPAVLLTPPRCLTANRTQQGVLLSWLPPANHTSEIDRYIIELRVGERWDILDDAIPPGVTELLAKDLIQESWYEFRVTAVMDDLISESSNVVGVSSTDIVFPPEVAEEGVARPLVAGVVATICFLTTAVLFSTLAAFFVNKQRRRKLKRKPDPPLSVTHCRKSVETPTAQTENQWLKSDALTQYSSSSGKESPESTRSLGAPSESSEDGAAPHVERELSLYRKTKRAMAGRKPSVSKQESEATPPIELISRGPDGRFIMEPPVQQGRIQGFPFVEESDLYPEFCQSDEENEDLCVMPPVMAIIRPQISPVSSNQESYLQPPPCSPCLHSPMAELTVMDSPGQIDPGPRATATPQGSFYSFASGPSGLLSPFYMPEGSPNSSVMSSPPLLHRDFFIQPAVPEEDLEGDVQHFGTSCSPLISCTSFEGPQFVFPPQHPFHLHQDAPDHAPSLPHILPQRSLQPSFLQVPSFPGSVMLAPPLGPPAPSSSMVPLQGPLPPCSAIQDPQGPGQLRHTSQGMGVLVLPYPPPLLSGPDSGWWFEPQPQLSPRETRHVDVSLGQVVLQPSRLSPLTQSPPESLGSSQESIVRPRPRPGVTHASVRSELGAVTLLPPRGGSPTPQQASSAYHALMALATTASSYPPESPPPSKEGSDGFGQISTHRSTDEEVPPSEPSLHQFSASGHSGRTTDI